MPPSQLIERAFREKIVLVGVALGDETLDDVDASLDELSQLVDTAGADEVARVVQRRDAPDPAYYVGKGKVDELREVSLDVDSDTVVFDDELTPAQQRNLEKLLGRTAIDRTAVILDIFAQNAASQEGKAQVELALLRYRLPRLRGRGKALSQQAGGMSAGGARIGTRGPGETQLEVDRRRILRRITRARGRAARDHPPPRHATQGSPPQPPRPRRHRRLHERRQVDPAEPAHRRRRARRGSVVRHPRRHDTTPAAPRRRVRARLRHRRLHPQASAWPRRGVQVDPRRRRRRRSARARRRLLGAEPARADPGRARRPHRDRRRPRSGAARVQQGGPRQRGGEAARRSPSRFGRHLGAHGRGGRRAAPSGFRPHPRPSPTSSSSSCPTTGATSSPPSTARARS